MVSNFVYILVMFYWIFDLDQLKVWSLPSAAIAKNTSSYASTLTIHWKCKIPTPFLINHKKIENSGSSFNLKTCEFKIIREYEKDAEM